MLFLCGGDHKLPVSEGSLQSDSPTYIHHTSRFAAHKLRQQLNYADQHGAQIYKVEQGKGAIVVFLREAGILTSQALENTSDDYQRNTLIVENNNHTDKPIS
jgi:hypothetical protein